MKDIQDRNCPRTERQMQLHRLPKAVLAIHEHDQDLSTASACSHRKLSRERTMISGTLSITGTSDA